MSPASRVSHIDEVGVVVQPNLGSALAATLQSLARPGRVLVVRETFADCVPGEPVSLAERSDVPGLVVLRGFTKTRGRTRTWGLAGLPVDYLLAPADLVWTRPRTWR